MGPEGTDGGDAGGVRAERGGMPPTRQPGSLHHQAALLGGAANVRGLREQRFAGDASIYRSAELRIFLARFFLLFPTDFGVFGLGDVGRVFLDGESSDKWYTARGAGIWFAPVRRSSTVQLSVAESEGRRALYISVGFAF